MSELALFGGEPRRSAPWPRWPEHGDEERRAILEALEGGEWGGFPMPNRHAARFASAFAARHDSTHALCVANGTVSLEVALQAIGIEPGAEVIVPAYTFEATAAAVLFAGCVPVFADVDPSNWCIDPDHVESLITPRTQALMPVHLAMSIADMDRLGEIATHHGLAVVEDCAHAHGARWRGRTVGSLGAAGSFSFQTSKLMTAGEGGIVTTSDDRTFDRLFALVNCGRQRPGAQARRADDVQLVGHNYRLTDLQAALLEVQLERLDRQHRRRAENAEALRHGLAQRPGLHPLDDDPRVTTRAIYQYLFRFDAEAVGVSRDRFVAALAAEGVPCDGVFYESLPQSPLLPALTDRHPGFATRKQEACPVAARAAYAESVWLPHQLLLGDGQDVDDILAAIDKVCAHRDALRAAEHPEFEQRSRARTRRD